jgi:hypothetical protein
MTRGQALLVGTLAGAGVILSMTPVFFWFPGSWFPKSWDPVRVILCLYVIALFAVSAFAGAKTGRVATTVAGLWVGQIVSVVVPAIVVSTYSLGPRDNPQGIIVVLALALPFITLLGVVVSLAGAWLGRRVVANTRTGTRDP